MKTFAKPGNLMERRRLIKLTIILLGLFKYLPHCVGQVLTIDNRLFVVPNDCYMRVSIGSRLAGSSVTWSSQANSVSDCEAACSANGTSCGAFSFGVGFSGNGTCLFGREVQRQELQKDEDYDVYAKGKVSLLGCRSRALQNLSSGPVNQTGNSGTSKENKPAALSINGLFNNFSLLNSLGSFKTRNRNSSASMDSPTSPFSLEPLDDDRTRIFDILQNRGQHVGAQPNHDIFGFPQFPPSRNLGSYEYGDDRKTVWDNKLSSPYNNGVFGQRIRPLENFYPLGIATPILKQFPLDYEDVSFDPDLYSEFGQKLNPRPSAHLSHQDTGNVWWDSSSRSQLASQLSAEAETRGTDTLDGENACFRRLFAGKRIVDAYVRRAMECDRLHDCRRMCEYERGFTCEGFNYRSQLGSKSICELTSMPPNRVDNNRDFSVDHHCDFYERDWTQRQCFQGRSKRPLPYVPPTPPNWWSQPPRPNWNSPSGHRESYGPSTRPIKPPVGAPVPVPYGGSFEEDTRLTLHLPKPIEPDRRPRPNYAGDSWMRPEDPRPLPVRPLEDFYPPRDRPRPYDRPQDNFYHRDRPQPDYKPPNYLPSRPGFDGYNGNGYAYGRPSVNPWQQNHFPQYPLHRRQGYEPNPESNEVGAPYIPDRRKPGKPEGWDTYGYSYAHDYDTHYIAPKPPPSIHPEPRPYPSNPPDNHHHTFYHNGGGYGYDAPAVPPKVNPPANQCSVRSAGGFKLTRGIIRKSYLTANVEQCSSLCENQKEFTCRTFAYRYNLAATSPADNCLQSDAVFEDLVFYTDLEPNRDYDIYAMLGNPKWCEMQTRPATNPRRPRPPDECFWRVRSGFNMPPGVIKKPVCVQGMGECQVQCVTSQDFTCRSFVFRYETHPGNGLPNCFLSDWPAMEIDPHNMQDMEGAELYERGSFGRGCEPHHPIPQPPDPNRPSPEHKPLRPDDASCYAGYDRPCKLTPYAIILATRVDSAADCRRKCSVMRQRDASPCMSFNYKIEDRHGDNCYLSDIPTRDLRPGLDYVHDEEYILYVWKELEPKCITLDDRQPNYRPLPPGYEHNLAPAPKPFARPENPYYHDVSVPDPNKPGIPALVPGMHTGIKGEFGPAADERFFFPMVPHELAIFGRFTVNGHPCRRGTKCERNTVLGFWFCEPEGAEPGTWEYCCEASHHCGFSQGFKYPWCYVGIAEDQWRPCSERYYPYQINPRPARPNGHTRPFIMKGHDDDYHSRHWPVAFLHGECPPNGTDSVALANVITDRTMNESFIFNSENRKMNPTSTNHTNRRMAVGSTEQNNKVKLVSLRTISTKRNRTVDKFAHQRLNSRYKPMTSSTNTSVDYSPRFSRDNNSGQYYITKKLQAQLPSQSEEKPKPSAKIERINRITNIKRNDSPGQSFITSKGPPTTTRTMSITIPALSSTTVNQTTDSNAKKHWIKLPTVDGSDV